VTSATPFHFTTLFGSNFVPVTVMVVLDEPATIGLGETDVSAGTGFTALIATPADVPPPGAGVVTVSIVETGAATYALGTVAFNDVAEEYVVVSETPFQFTTLFDSKFVPVTVTTAFAEPTRIDFGLTDVKVGTGLVTVNVTEADVPPPGVGVCTEILNAPAASRSPSGTVAFSDVAEV
jgi:hypothetical protein